MTARFSEASDRLSLVAAPTPSGGFTFACWARLGTDANQRGTILRLYDAVTTFAFGVGADGVTLGCVSVGNTGGVNVGAMAVGTWYRVALTVSGTSGTVYLAEDQTGTITSQTGTVSGGSTVPTALAVGGRSPADSSEPWPGDLAYPRIWDRVLSQSALEDQWKLAAPTDSPVWADWPLTEDLGDDSGNARHLVAGTTPVEFLVDDEPPLGGNTSPSITTLAVSAAGANATATITAIDAQTLTGATYVVDWGDGSASSGSSTSYNHTYSSAGTYAVLASVTDSGGLSGYKAAPLRVSVPTATSTSTIGLFRAALVDALDTDVLAGKVHYAWPGPQIAKGAHEVFWFDEIPNWSQIIPNMKAGRKQRQETYTLEGVLWVAQPDVGVAGAQTCFERALVLAAVPENALADDVQLGDTNIQWGLLAERTLALIPHENGWAAMITMRFEGNARLT